MSVFIYIVTKTASLLLSAIEVMLFLRVFAQIFADDDSPFNSFLYFMTEPVIMPFRLIFDRFETFRNFPIDVSYIFASFAIVLLNGMIS